MDFKTYQDKAMRTATMYETIQEQMVNAALGLTGEAGEVADYLKKGLFQGHEIDREVIAKELGDIMWYIALMCDALGINYTMKDIAEKNIEKLIKRYPDGFEAKNSLNRAE